MAQPAVASKRAELTLRRDYPWDLLLIGLALIVGGVLSVSGHSISCEGGAEEGRR